MAVLSGPLTGGPTIPAGAQKISLKYIDAAASTSKEDVTDLSDASRQYAAPPLTDTGAAGASATCSASGILKGTEPEVTPITTKYGWICTDTEVVYEVGKYATWSANWSYIEDPGT